MRILGYTFDFCELCKLLDKSSNCRFSPIQQEYIAQQVKGRSRKVCMYKNTLIKWTVIEYNCIILAI